MDHRTHNYMIRLFKIMSNSHRLKIADLLLSSGKPMTVGAMAERLGMDQAHLSSHLSQMRAAHIVRADQQGLHMHYTVKDPNVALIFKHLTYQPNP